MLIVLKCFKILCKLEEKHKHSYHCQFPEAVRIQSPFCVALARWPEEGIFSGLISFSLTEACTCFIIIVGQGQCMFNSLFLFSRLFLVCAKHCAKYHPHGLPNCHHSLQCSQQQVLHLLRLPLLRTSDLSLVFFPLM